MENAWYTVQDYAHFYWKYANGLWYGMTPMQYGCLLIAIALTGYMLMKNGVKGP